METPFVIPTCRHPSSKTRQRWTQQSRLYCAKGIMLSQGKKQKWNYTTARLTKGEKVFLPFWQRRKKRKFRRDSQKGGKIHENTKSRIYAKVNQIQSTEKQTDCCEKDFLTLELKVLWVMRKVFIEAFKPSASLYSTFPTRNWLNIFRNSFITHSKLSQQDTALMKTSVD